MKMICRSLLLLFAALAGAPAPSQAADELPRLGVALDETSVSGLSSGAYLAGQIELAHSSKVVGAGIVAGGPFACAETASSRLFPYWPVVMWQNAMQAKYACMEVSWGAPDADALAERAEELADEGKIDPLSGVADDRIYLFTGANDRTVRREVVEAAKRFYEKAGVPAGQVKFEEGDGGHAFLTETEGTSCGASRQPYISDCDRDQAKEILEWIYGDLAEPSDNPSGRFIVFDQDAFDEGEASGLAKEGVVYVPAECQNQPGCRLHIALHGCNQARESVGDDFVKKSGFARYADSNRLIILFPQATSSLVNPNGCWDWWGYSDVDYLSKDAPQVKAIWAMAERLAAQP